MNKINLYKQRQSKNRVSILTSLALLASPLVLPLQQAQAASLTTVVNFNGTNGAAPRAGVLQGTDLNLYGTTSAGGSSNNGTVFKLSGAGFSVLTTLINFTGTVPPNRGTNPIARLFQASNGHLYGLTFTGGTSNLGTLFKLASPAFTSLTTLVNHNGANGANPAGRLIAGSNPSVLWGTSSAGGTSNRGTIFNTPLNGTVVTPVISFTGANGATPLARLQLVTTNGSYYGTASLGGASNRGVVFKYTPTNPIATRYSFSSFTGANGASPESGLIVSNGFLYGTTRLGGAGNVGAIFRVPIGTAANPIGAPVLVASFNGTTNGANPKAALTPGATSGIFYGAASTGGANNKGVVYRLNVGTTSTITPLISFNATAGTTGTNTNGATPESTLIPVGTDYYGTASSGGTSGRGTVFRFTP
jgi:uncharacterized repeat protein (TIGR03803 family)